MPTASDLFRKHGQPLPPYGAILGHEDNPGEKVLTPLLQALGFDSTLDIDRKPTLKHGILGPKSWRAPDFGILPRETVGRKQYGMVADTKPANDDLDKWVEKLAGYCGLAGAVRGILMDGLNFIIIEPTRGVVEWRSLDDIPTKDELEQLVNTPSTQYQEQDIIYATRVTELIDESVVNELARRCHEIIRSRKGLAVPDRLYEFSKLLVARIIDERRFGERKQSQLYLTGSNMKDLRTRGVSVKSYVEERFGSTQAAVGIFSPDDGIDLPEDVIEEIIAYLDEHQLWSRQIDVLGQVYERFLADTMTGQELGQYFTPRSVVETIVKMVNPSLGATILDPACGTGGFLIYALQYLVNKHNLSDPKNIKQAAMNLYGIDTFRSAAKLCEINLWLHGDSHENVRQADSLNFQTAPDFVKKALASPETDGLDVILTNPPFGAKEGNRLSSDYVGRISNGWHTLGANLFECGVSKGKFRTLQAQSPFVELCVKCLKRPAQPQQGGRLGIVIENGLLSNVSGEEPLIRDIIKRECIIKAIVGLPKGTFKPYGSNVIPCFMILRRKHPSELQGPIFRAEVTRVGLVPGIDRYRKDSDEDLQLVVQYWREIQSGTRDSKH